MTGTPPAAVPGRRAVAPLYAAGFTTAFGAHAIAANLSGYTRERHDSLLVLGVLLALYDGAEVLLKPVFGALSDRAGPRPVLLGGSPLRPDPAGTRREARHKAWASLHINGSHAGG